MASGGCSVDGRDYDSRVDYEHYHASASVLGGTFMVSGFISSFRSSAAGTFMVFGLLQEFRRYEGPSGTASYS